MADERAARRERPYLYLVFAAAAAFFVACLVVESDTVPTWEIDVITWFNDAPIWLVYAIWPIMQAGTFWSPLVIGAVVAWAYGQRRALAVLTAGIIAWVLAKVVKDIVERGRPPAFIPDIELHEGDGSGLGFVSGHTAIAFAVATALVPALPRWGRVVAFALATVVGVSRMVYGMHFPLDVVGGAALGIVIGGAVDLVVAAVSGGSAGFRRTDEPANA
jgi:undecaprenyl-diphosphatase